MTNTPSKILVISNSYPNPYKPYAGKYIERHVSLHEQMGLKVRVLSSGDSRQGRLRSVWKYILLTIKVFLTMVTTNFDLVHAHWEFPSGLLGLIAGKTRGKPFVLTSHGAFTDGFDKRSYFVRYFVKLVLSRANAIITVGEAQKLGVQAIADLPKDKIEVINMGVWLPESPQTQREARRSLGLDVDATIVVFIGNLLSRKGPDILIKAVSLLAKNERAFQVFIGGQGPEAANLLAMINGLKLRDKVEFIGLIPPEKVFSWFSAADICVVPSRTEPFGLVAIEAMACGTPVVAAAVGGLAETITHGVNGFLFQVGDHAALAEQLRQLLNDEPLRKSVIEAGLKTAAQHDMRLKANQVESIYKRVLRQK